MKRNSSRQKMVRKKKKKTTSHTSKWILRNHQMVLPKGENGLAEGPQDDLKASTSMHIPLNNYLHSASMRQAVDWSSSAAAS